MTVSEPPVRSTAAVDAPSQDLEQRVSLFLQTQHVAIGAPLRIRADRGVVTISGRVRSFYQRQLILALARRVAGVLRVDDLLEVESPGPFPVPAWSADQPAWPALVV